MTEVDWSEVEPELVAFLFEQSEKVLEAQLQCALASDARAITAASILSGLGGAVVAGTVSLWAAGQPGFMLPPGLTFGVCLLGAAYLFFKAAQPIDFHGPGSRPEQWLRSIGLPVARARGFEIDNYQSMIQRNDLAMDIAARTFALGRNLALASTPVAVGVGVVSYLLS